jgi:hypothetical protein
VAAEAACALHEETLARARRALGDEHPAAIDAARQLGRDLHDLGDVEHARWFGGDTLARAQRVLGIDTANDLAADLHALGEKEAARQLGEDTLTRARRVFGDNRLRTLRAAGIVAGRPLASPEGELAGPRFSGAAPET